MTAHSVLGKICVYLFPTYRQGVIIAILVKLNVISRGPLWDWQSPKEVAVGLQVNSVVPELSGTLVLVKRVSPIISTRPNSMQAVGLHVRKEES